MPPGGARRVPIGPGRTVSALPAIDALRGRAPAAGSRRMRDAMLFTTAVAGSSLFLQRFGLPAGDKAISIVGFIGLGGAAVGLARGALVLDRVRFPAFLFLCAWAVLGLAYGQVFPNRFQVPPSQQSLFQFLVFTSFAPLSFAERMPEAMFFRRVTNLLGVVGGAGIVQFVAQFAGLGLFSFRGLVPDRLLFEDGYNLQIPAGFGGVFKSNGFFLLEPSIFSQIMALGLMIEVLTFVRPRFLLLFLAGFLLSMAGTGWVVIAAFVVTVAFGMGWRGVLLAVTTLVVLAGLGLGVALFAPDAAAAFSGRLGEVFLPQTSGHLRFVTPFWLLNDVLGLQPDAAWMGLGGGVSERVPLPYEYDVNTPVKIGLEYGAGGPGRLSAVVLVAHRRSPRAGGPAGSVPCTRASDHHGRLSAISAGAVSYTAADHLGRPPRAHVADVTAQPSPGSAPPV